MNNTTTAPAVDTDKLMAFVFKAVEEVGAVLNGALVVMGDRLGYYRSLADHGPSTPAELAERTNTDQHYAREWLNAQAAGSFVTYDPSTGRYELPPEHAVALTDETSPAFVGGLFQIAHGTVCDSARILEVARTGDGVGWGDHNSDVHVGCERFFAPTYNAHLVADWLPALDGVVDKLSKGASVADVGCGHGASTILMAQVLSELTGAWHRLPLRIDRDRAGPRGPDGIDLADRIRDRRRGRLQRRPLRLGDDVRLPARHGRSGRRRPSCPRGDRRRRHVDDRRTDRRGPRRGQPESGRAHLLRVLDVVVHPVVPVAAGRTGTGNAGGPGTHPRRRVGGRIHPFPDRRADTVQQCVRGPALNAAMMGDDGCVKAEQRPARLPDRSGAASRDGVSLHYDIYGDDIHGDAATTVMLLPTWSVVPSRFWKAQVAFLARHYRVITFDGRGSGRSSRPRGAAAFADREFAADALAVLDATETERAVLVGFSCGATWAVHLAAAHPERALGVVAIAPACGLRDHPPGRRTCPLAKDFRRSAGLAEIHAAQLAAR